MMSRSNAGGSRETRDQRGEASRARSRRAAACAPSALLAVVPGPVSASRAAGRTCTTSRSTAGCGRARSSPTARARGRSSKAPSRAARCRKTRRSSPARSTRRRSRSCRSRSTRRSLDRGQERFNIYCSPCHGKTGDRQRHGRAARIPPAAVVSHRPAAPGRRRLLLRRDHERLRRDAGLPGADRAARSLGDRRLHPRAAAQPARARPPTCPAAIRRRSRSQQAAANTAPEKH